MWIFETTNLRSMENEYDNYDPKLVVKCLLDNELYSEAEKILIGMGTRARSPLVAAISDRRFSRSLSDEVIAKQDILYARTKPLHSVLRVLRRMPAPQVADAVAHLTDDPDEDTRENAIHLVCSSGNDTFVEKIASFIASENPDIQNAAVTGLASGNTLGFSETVRDRLLAAVQVAAARGNKYGNRAPECLLRLDPRKGAEFLTSRDSLSPDNPQLYWYVKALLESSVIVPEERLLPLVNCAKLIEDSPETVRDIVQILARCNSKVALDAVFDALKSPSPQVQEGAALALLTRAGIDNPLGTALQAVRKNSITSVPPPIAYYFAVQVFVGDVANGGLTNYLGNEASNYWRYAREGFLAIKAARQAALFDQALSYFPESTPSIDWGERNAQLREMCVKDPGLFSSIESQLIDLLPDLEAKLTIFAAAHADAFKAYIGLVKK